MEGAGPKRGCDLLLELGIRSTGGDFENLLARRKRVLHVPSLQPHAINLLDPVTGRCQTVGLGLPTWKDLEDYALRVHLYTEASRPACQRIRDEQRH